MRFPGPVSVAKRVRPAVKSADVEGYPAPDHGRLPTPATPCNPASLRKIFEIPRTSEDVHSADAVHTHRSSSTGCNPS